jgi:hypothetical protein
MTVETTRRAVLAGAPAIALAATIPGTLKAAPTDNAAWERVKADYTTACQRFTAAQDAYTRVDGEQIDFNATAPEREVAYTEKGWRVVSDDMHIEAKPREGRFVLTRNTLAIAPKDMKATPEYAAFAAELEAWQTSRESYAEARGWQAAHLEWEDALAAQTTAWGALIACPVQTAPQIAEKLTLAQRVPIEEDEAAKLLDAINADLTRNTAH